MAPSVALAYFLVLGGTPIGEQIGVLRFINTLLGAIIVVIYVRQAPARFDRIDAAALVAVLLTAISALASPFPRQALDALIAILAYAAIFYLARDLVHRPKVGRMAVWTMRGLSLAITIYAVGGYLPLYVEWMVLTGGEILPPIGLPFVARPWGHAYDLTTLGVMLLPSWFVPPRTRTLVGLGVASGTLFAFVILLLGSRAQWLALVVSTLILGAPRLIGWVRAASRPMQLLAAAATLIALAFVSIIGGPLLDRLFTGATIGQRVQMWGAGIDAWLDRPVTGYGPGSFPWVLQTTDYFDTNSIHPRHPDSAPLQLLPELGLVGILAAGLVVAAVVTPLLRERRALFLWPIAVFLVAGIGGNPTDFSYLVVIAAVWAAIGLPRRQTSASIAPARRPVLRPASYGLMALIAIPMTAMLVAGIAFDAAAQAATRGDLATARRNLDGAVLLDPAMAVYHRQSGIAALLDGDTRGAESALLRAVKLNPNDDLSWRSLAVTRHAANDPVAASMALSAALSLQRSDPSNLILLARWQADEDDEEALRETVAEIALAWPWVLAAPGWNDAIGDRVPGIEAVGLALDRWQEGKPSPEPLRIQPLILAALAGRQDLFASAAELAGESPALMSATWAVLTCDPDSAERLADIPDADRRSSTFFALRIQYASETGGADESDLRLHELATFTSPERFSTDLMMNPLHENNEQGNVDPWGYDRRTIQWDRSPVVLPLPEAGWRRSLIDLGGARREMGLESPRHSCGSE